MIFAAASTIFNIWGPKILSKAITELFNGLIKKYQGTGDINFEKIGGILLFMLALYGVASLFGIIQGWIMSTISQKSHIGCGKKFLKNQSHADELF